MGKCMGLFLRFARHPSPRGGYGADDGLAAGVDGDVLDRDLLLALAPVAIERFKQDGERA
jgi:hypothetical protein